MPDQQDPIDVDATLVTMVAWSVEVDKELTSILAGIGGVSAVVTKGLGQLNANDIALGKAIAQIDIKLDGEHFEGRLDTTDIDDIIRITKAAGGKSKMKDLAKAARKKSGGKKKRYARKIAMYGAGVAVGVGAKMAYDATYGADPTADDAAFTGVDVGPGADAGAQGWGQGAPGQT